MLHLVSDSVATNKAVYCSKDPAPANKKAYVSGLFYVASSRPSSDNMLPDVVEIAIVC